MKTCSTCKKSLRPSAFGRALKNPDGLAYNCRACANAYLKAHYERNKAAYIAKARKWEATIKSFILEAKRAPCVDCDGSFAPCVMDFDHLPGNEKEFGVAEGRSQGIERVKAEIAKCDLVCANCHRIRTFNRRGTIQRN